MHFLISVWYFVGKSLESWTPNLKVESLSLGPAGIVGGESKCTFTSARSSALSTFNTTTEVPLSKAPNPQLLPGRVCAHFGWVKCRAQIPSMGHCTWSYVTSLCMHILLLDL